MHGAGSRAGSWIVLALGLACLSGCTFFPSRGPVADFFIKDYDLPPYRADEAAFQRERRSVEPSPASGALGGVAGTFAGGRFKAWRATAGGSLGGLGGATVGWSHAKAERVEPLPEDYELFSLALPVIATDPNTGLLVGVLPVAVLREGERITNIFAPDVVWNEIQGIGANFRMRRFFSDDAALSVDGGSSTEGAQEYELIYSQRRIGPNQLLYYRTHFAYTTELAERFFGIGSGTRASDESTYVFRRTIGEAVLGLQLPLNLSLELRERVVSSSVGPGRLDGVASARVRYADVPGVRDGRMTILAHQVRLAYDSRDSRHAPTEGLYADFVYELGDEALGSDTRFQRFSGQVLVLLPKVEKRFTTAVRFAAWYLKGGQVPFWELTRIGGKATHRGYGEGRFVDRHGFVLNVEERVNLFNLHIAGVEQVLQVAAFVDVGRVFSDDESFTLKDSKVAAGGAVRIIVPGSELVTSIDVGISSEGTAVFVGLDYPF